jgi:HD-like signal output (HDOD) protein
VAETAEKQGPDDGLSDMMTTSTVVGKEIALERLYAELLLPMWLDPVVNKVINLMLSGRESAERYASILRFDHRMIDYVIQNANALTQKENKIVDPAHAVSVLGIEKMRNTLLGRGIYTRFYQPGGEFKELEFAEYAQYVSFAQRAETVAKSLKNPYMEIAFAGGVLFDIFQAKFKSNPMYEPFLPQILEFVDHVWKRSLRAAIVSTLLSDHVNLSHKKFAFVTGLVHNIGKLVLLAYAPKEYLALVDYVKAQNVESAEEEARTFGIDHAQAGSLYLGQIRFLGEVEVAVDFHHGNWILKFQNLPMYHFSGLIHTAAQVVTQVKDKETLITNEKDAFFNAEEFLCLGISLADFVKIQKRYLKLRDIDGTS